FTVSLFLATLTFNGGSQHMADLLDHAKLGIVAGSLLAGIGGWLMLHLCLPKTPFAADDEE
ncbi:MAG: Na+/H+ antiporter NhaA, partial [Muribaculaceae bacterium]|nr:Na+/H+ antiporter NhaA [Muribaculaceae bacterium]